MSAFSRRAFLGMALLPWMVPSAKAALGRLNLTADRLSTGKQYVNGHIDAAGKHYVSGFDAHGCEWFRLGLPGKAHGFAADPVKPGRIIALPTLPGTRAAVLDTANGKQLAIIKSRPGRHFNGHGCFSPDGRYLFTSENIAHSAEGVIGVRDGRDFSFLREISGHGIGPHDIHLLPDGVTLVVAGGGIQTHPDSGKRELNINKMQSALLFIDSRDGRLVQRREIAVPRLSIRHLDVGVNGEVLVACQYKGKRQMPKLVGLQQGQGQIEMLDIDDNNLWPLKNYTASARIAANGIAAVTCPRGDRLTLWDLRQKKFLKSIEIKDVGGIEIAADGKHFIVTANVGELYHIDATNLQSKPLGKTWQNAKWTNHMVKTVA